MGKNKKSRGDSHSKKKRVMIIYSDDKDWGVGDFYPMQNWSLEDRQLWEKIMIEKKNK